MKFLREVSGERNVTDRNAALHHKDRDDDDDDDCIVFLLYTSKISKFFRYIQPSLTGPTSVNCYLLLYIILWVLQFDSLVAST
jgi:hypothetical protein